MDYLLVLYENQECNLIARDYSLPLWTQVSYLYERKGAIWVEYEFETDKITLENLRITDEHLQVIHRNI